ncbi:single-stranded DNA-binding protein [Collinsella sp. KGMB02528]|uniref:Single-stranded DNA-binding protein n=1 Tax=Collinsella acetigenes TaxID=2713419 RepID=A0A7X9UBY9_9ACTN|nr:single-stranded DNA-binding protein [Collinsella acetigenes]NMF55704.1 single-stranded DNA-binding protein [Collinsella acetigenes]
MSINRTVISGNLTRDPDVRATAAGTQVLSFTVAVNDRRKNQQTGEWEDHANFVGCTMFGARAEAVGRYLSKGSKVCVEGKLRYSAWEDRDGGKRSKLEVIVDEIEFMSSRQRAEQGNPPYVAERPQAPQAYAPQAYQNPPAMPPQRPQAPAPQAPQAYAPQPVQPELYDEDIPF